MSQSGLDDMTLLSKLTNEQIMQNLKERFDNGIIYVCLFLLIFFYYFLIFFINFFFVLNRLILVKYWFLLILINGSKSLVLKLFIVMLVKLELNYLLIFMVLLNKLIELWLMKMKTNVFLLRKIIFIYFFIIFFIYFVINFF